MAKGATTLQIVHPNEDLTFPPGTERGRAVNTLMDFLTGCLIGAKGGQGLALLLGQGGTQASGTLTVEAGIGTVGGSINDVDVMVEAAAEDNETASLVAAAINSNPSLKGVVTASATDAVVAIQSVEYGAGGNAITLEAIGGLTASGATLTGGVPPVLTPLKR